LEGIFERGEFRILEKLARGAGKTSRTSKVECGGGRILKLSWSSRYSTLDVVKQNDEIEALKGRGKAACGA
jgi:hypothetical protein